MQTDGIFNSKLINKLIDKRNLTSICIDIWQRMDNDR